MIVFLVGISGVEGHCVFLRGMVSMRVRIFFSMFSCGHVMSSTFSFEGAGLHPVFLSDFDAIKEALVLTGSSLHWVGDSVRDIVSSPIWCRRVCDGDGGLDIEVASFNPHEDSVD